MSKTNGSQFRVMIPADVNYLVKALALLFVVLTISLIILVTFALKYLHMKAGVTVGVGCGVALTFTLLSIFYILNLSFQTGMIFIMDRRGIVDSASPVQWGLLPLEQIQSIKFTSSLFGSFLRIQLKNKLAVGNLSGLRKLYARFFRFFHSHCVYIPLGVLDVSKMNLESQLLHFSAMMRDLFEQQASGPSEVLDHLMSEENSIDENTVFDATKTSYQVPGASPSQDPMDPAKTQVYVEPEINETHSEKTQIVMRVSALKDYVRNTRLDEKLCELYTDFISQLPVWKETGDLRFPSYIEATEQVEKEFDYEEVEFRFHDKSFQCSLRKDIGPSSMALLSMAYEGRVKIAIRAEVEIGSLEPKEVEVFHKGEWEEQFLELFQQATSNHFHAPLSEIDGVTQTKTLDIERLKKSFSSDSKNGK